jgi:hypothetical protein
MARKKSAAAPVLLTVTPENVGSLVEALLVVAKTDPTRLPGHGYTAGNPVTIGPRVLTGADWAKKQIARAQAAGADWLAGVKAPSREPLAAAAEANARWKNSVQAALAEDRFLKGVKSADEASMYATIEAGGAAVFTEGIRRREAKITRKVAALRELVLAAVTALDKMDTSTDAARKAKMTANYDAMKAVGKALRES